MWMRSSLGVRASYCPCRSSSSPGFDPSILRHNRIWGAADEAVLNTVNINKIQKNPPEFKCCLLPVGIQYGKDYCYTYFPTKVCAKGLGSEMDFFVFFTWIKDTDSCFHIQMFSGFDKNFFIIHIRTLGGGGGWSVVPDFWNSVSCVNKCITEAQKELGATVRVLVCLFIQQL